MLHLPKRTHIVAFCFLFASCIIHLYHSYNNVYFLIPDSYQYLNRAQEIAAGKPLINPFRLPLYPLILKETLSLDGSQEINSTTLPNHPLRNVIILQEILTILGLFFFLAIASFLFGRNLPFMTVAFLFGLNINIFGWGKNILTELTTIVIMIVLIYSCYQYILRHRLLDLLLIPSLCTLLVLLRPIYLLLPFAILPPLMYFFIRHDKRTYAIFLAVFLIATLFVPLLYVKENTRLWGYSGISTVSDHNLMAKTIQYQLDTRALSDDVYTLKLKNCINNYIPGKQLDIALYECTTSLGITNDPYDVQSAKITRSFTREIIANQPILYLSQSIKLIPTVLTNTKPDPIDWISTYSSIPILSRLWAFFHRFFNSLQIVTLSFLIFFPLHIIRFLRNPTLENTCLFVIGSIILYQIFSTALFVHINYIRLRAPIEALLLLFCGYYFFYYLGIIIHQMKKVRLCQVRLGGFLPNDSNRGVETPYRPVRLVWYWGKNFMKRILIPLALIAVLLPRFLYHLYTPIYYHYPDTFHYINRALEMKEGKSIITPFRLPLYPVLLKQIIRTKIPIPVNSDTIGFINFRPLLHIQQIAGIISSFVVLIIAIRIFGYSVKMLIASILFGTNILIIGFEINVLTETLSMTLLLLSLVFTIFYIDSRKIGHFLLALIAQIFLFLLRPVYFLYPLVLIPVIGLFLLRNRQKRSFLLSTILISTFLLIPLLYATENSRNYNYFGITTVGGHNLFAKVIQYDLDTKGINKSVPFAQTLKDCIPRHKGEQSIVIDDCVRELNLSANLYDTVSSPILSNFAMKVILQQPLAYIGHSLQLLPDALTHFYPIPFDFISPYSTQPQLYTFWKFSYQFFHLLQRLMIGFLLFFPFSLYAYYKNPDKINTILLIMGTSILYLLFFNTFFVQSEYDRLRAPIEPILLLFCFYYYVKLFAWVRTLFIRGKTIIAVSPHKKSAT